jgi:hypothetical protein
MVYENSLRLMSVTGLLSVQKTNSVSPFVSLLRDHAALKAQKYLRAGLCPHMYHAFKCLMRRAMNVQHHCGKQQNTVNGNTHSYVRLKTNRLRNNITQCSSLQENSPSIFCFLSHQIVGSCGSGR